MSRIYLLPLLLLTTLAACELPRDGPDMVEYAADPAAGEIPLEFGGPGETALTVPVHINGEGPYDFVLDTGATLTCVDRRLADELDLPEDPRPGIGAGAAGTGRVKIVRIDSLRIGNTRASGLDACVLDLAHTRDIGVEIDGLLGLNVLRSFRVTLDFRRGVLLLEDPN